MIETIKDIIKKASDTASIKTGEHSIIIGIDTIAKQAGIRVNECERWLEYMLNNKIISAVLVPFQSYKRIKYSTVKAFPDAIHSIAGLPAEYKYNKFFIQSAQKKNKKKEKKKDIGPQDSGHMVERNMNGEGARG